MARYEVINFLQRWWVVPVSLAAGFLVAWLLTSVMGCASPEKKIASIKIKTDDFEKTERFALSCAQFFTGSANDSGSKVALCQGLFDEIVTDRKINRNKLVREYCTLPDSRDREICEKTLNAR